MVNAPDVDRARPSRITPQLWVGADLPDDPDEAATTLHAWQQLGITAVVDTRSEWNDQRLVADLAPEIEYLHKGVHDGGEDAPFAWFDAVVAWVQKRTALDNVVLVHCHLGVNRSPSAVFAVLLSRGWDPIEAIELIRHARPIAAVGYAESALKWMHWTRSGSNRHLTDLKSDVDRLRVWREANTVFSVATHRAIVDLETAPRHRAPVKSQSAAIQHLLDDPDPRVRAIAALAVSTHRSEQPGDGAENSTRSDTNQAGGRR